jgi:hypothetical protein
MSFHGDTYSARPNRVALINGVDLRLLNDLAIIVEILGVGPVLVDPYL